MSTALERHNARLLLFAQCLDPNTQSVMSAGIEIHRHQRDREYILLRLAQSNADPWNMKALYLEAQEALDQGGDFATALFNADMLYMIYSKLEYAQIRSHLESSSDFSSVTSTEVKKKARIAAEEVYKRTLQDIIYFHIPALEEFQMQLEQLQKSTSSSDFNARMSMHRGIIHVFAIFGYLGKDTIDFADVEAIHSVIGIGLIKDIIQSVQEKK